MVTTFCNFQQGDVSLLLLAHLETRLLTRRLSLWLPKYTLLTSSVSASRWETISLNNWTQWPGAVSAAGSGLYMGVEAMAVGLNRHILAECNAADLYYNFNFN